jgi:lipopolysaccharide/colanic/teichoic acid biosynthesis glycosyltransferase
MAHPAGKSLDLAERFLALLALLCVAPALILVGIVTWILSRRSPLIAHARVGQLGRPIHVLKLRTMWQPGARPVMRHWLIEEVGGEPAPKLKRSRDPRVSSRFAAFCRRYSIDELPQLWHVVKGEMALVGPRPMTMGELKQHYGPDAQEVLRMKPGLTGLWQVNGRSRLTYRERRVLDLYLVRNLSWRLYVNVLAATVPSVLSGKDAY